MEEVYALMKNDASVEKRFNSNEKIMRCIVIILILVLTVATGYIYYLGLWYPVYTEKIGAS